MKTIYTSCSSPELSLKQIKPLARQQCSPVKVSPSRSRCSPLQLRASADDGKDSFDASLEEEARLEALERGVKRKQGARAVSAQVRRVESTKATVQNQGGMAPWKEGELFPEGWEDMPITQKIAELYTGKRGLLFWAGKITYALIFALIGGWIVFRFVLPQLGILELQNGLDSPPNMG